jgi:hypothetical protein
MVGISNDDHNELVLDPFWQIPIITLGAFGHGQAM